MKPLQSRNHICLIVVLLAHPERRMSQNVSGNSDVLGCLSGDTCRSAIPNEMRTEVAAEIRESELSYTMIDIACGDPPTLSAEPQGVSLDVFYSVCPRQDRFGSHPQDEGRRKRERC